MEAAVADGLSNLTFGRLSRRLGVSDRMIVYYFPNKDALITEVLLLLGAHLQEALMEAFSGHAADHMALARRAWPVLAQPRFDATFGVFFEANGLAATGRQPYQAIVAGLVEAWVAWLAPLFEGDEAFCRAQAEATLVLVDGLLLLRQLAGAEAAQRAAVALGVGKPAQ